MFTRPAQWARGGRFEQRLRTIGKISRVDCKHFHDQCSAILGHQCELTQRSVVAGLI